MHGTFHGVLSLLLGGAALAVAVAAVITHAPLLGWGYIILVAAAGPVVLYAYCAKCPERRTGCRHGLPGPLTRMLPPRQTGPYTLRDYAGLVVPTVLMVALPQPYLWATPARGVIFWGLAVAAVAEIRRRVCPGCGNRYCPLRKPVSGCQEGCDAGAPRVDSGGRERR